ncbi:MAG: hypothetical protein R6U27_02375 [Desulfobacterales bacterium]
MPNSVSLRIFCLVIFLSGFFSGFLYCPESNADAPESIVKDFSPLSGVVVMVRNGEVIVDLDSSTGLAKGDLLSVMSPGEKLVHPVTGKVLGQLEKVEGVLKVTRVMDGFSFTRGLQVGEINVGDAVRRYEDIKAVFWDYTDKGNALFLSLQNELSHMNWMDFETAQKLRPKVPSIIPETETAVVFILKDEALQVRDPEFMIIREYKFLKPITQQDFLSYSKGREILPAPETLPVPEKYQNEITGIEPKFVEKEKLKKEVSSPTPESAQPVMPVFPVMPEKETAKAVEPVYQDSRLVDLLPGEPVISADFIPHENGLLLATTDGQKIRVFHISDKISQLMEKESPLHDPVLFLSWWKPEHSSSPLLAIVNWSGHAPTSTLFSMSNSQLQLVKDRISRFVAGFDSDGDRIPDMLLGQEYDPQEFFGYRIHEIELAGGEVKYKNPPMKLPRRFAVFGGLLSELTGNGDSEAAFIRNEILYIYSGKDLLYKSPKKMGGSLSTLTYEMNPGAKHIMTNSVSIEIAPVTVDLDGDGIKEMIAVASDRSLLSKTGISAGIQETWLTVLKYENKIFKEGTIGRKMSTPIQGMTVFGDKLLLVVSESGAVFSKGGQSRLMQLPLSR